MVEKTRSPLLVVKILTGKPLHKFMYRTANIYKALVEG